MLSSLKGFEDKEVVATVKMDGENTTLYPNYLHARSTEYEFHPSRTWIKSLHGKIGYQIPEGWRICGENLYAKHSIHYENLEDYFQVFSIWNENNYCLSWDETVEWCNLLELKTVPILYRGLWDEAKIKSLYESKFNGDACEGYVVRITDSFHYKDFRVHAGKYVRQGHILLGSDHWMHEKIVPNIVKSNSQPKK